MLIAGSKYHSGVTRDDLLKRHSYFQILFIELSWTGDPNNIVSLPGELGTGVSTSS